MTRRRPDGSPIWPAWYYNLEGDGKICHSPSEVPDGWQRKRLPNEVKIESTPTVVLDKNELIAELTKRGIEINPTWGNAHMKRIIDGDISSAG